MVQRGAFPSAERSRFSIFTEWTLLDEVRWGSYHPRYPHVSRGARELLIGGPWRVARAQGNRRKDLFDRQAGMACFRSLALELTFVPGRYANSLLQPFHPVVVARTRPTPMKAGSPWPIRNIEILLWNFFSLLPRKLRERIAVARNGGPRLIWRISGWTTSGTGGAPR